MASTEPTELLGRLVRTARRLQGLSQAEVAERGGPSTATLYLIEDGRSPRLQRSTRENLDQALGWPTGTTSAVMAGRYDEAERRLISVGAADQLVQVVRDGSYDLEGIAGTLYQHDTGQPISTASPRDAAEYARQAASLSAADRGLVPEYTALTDAERAQLIELLSGTTQEGLTTARRTLQAVIDMYGSELPSLDAALDRYREERTRLSIELGRTNARIDVYTERRAALLSGIEGFNALLRTMIDKQAALGFAQEAGSAADDGPSRDDGQEND